MDRPRTKAPQTPIYFITHWSGVFLEVRLRTVNPGERSSRSIVNRTTAARSLGVVESLILTGSGLVPILVYKRRGAKSRNCAESTDHLRHLSNRSDGLDALYHYRMDVNTPNEGKCLVEFFSRPPSAGYRLQFRRIRMKSGPEYLYCSNWMVDGGVNRWSTLASRKTHPRMSQDFRKPQWLRARRSRRARLSYIWPPGPTSRARRSAPPRPL